MGFFSANCTCGHPLLCDRATGDLNAWMNNAVVILPDGSIIKGRYDGYGGLDSSWGDFADAVGFSATVWHDACWRAAGRPADYRGPSESAEDQGWFFNDGAHDMAEPGTPR
jgi:hypothetical protein